MWIVNPQHSAELLLWELQGPSPLQTCKDWEGAYGNSDLRKFDQGPMMQKLEVTVKREQQLCDINLVYIPCPPGKGLKTVCSQTRWNPHWGDWWAVSIKVDGLVPVLLWVCGYWAVWSGKPETQKEPPMWYFIVQPVFFTLASALVLTWWSLALVLR